MTMHLFDALRRCVDCQESKPLDAFNTNRFRLDGYQAYCICGGPGGKRGLHLDHDHIDGSIRGWLCHTCNALLGQAKDDESILERAIAYLRRHRSAA